jgi:peptidoglycan/LPS O-acetylase OafA/YrhL
VMLSTLTGLRFFAIILIYFHHLEYPIGLGPAGVTFFFVLSGFIMAYNYNRKFIRLDTKELKRFYIKRLCKVYPLHVLTFLFSLPVVYLTNFKTNFGYAIINILLLQSYFPNGIQVFSFNSLAWFISDILMFYFLTPFVLFVLNKCQIVKNPKALISLSIFLFICQTAISCMAINKVQAYSIGWWFVYISPYSRVFDYLIGMFIGLFFIAVKNKILNLSLGKTLFGILEVSSVISFCTAIYCLPYFPFDSLRFGVYFIPVSVVVVLIFSFQQGFFSFILSKKIFVYLGNLSFIIYMIHQLAINYTAIFFSSPICGMIFDSKHFISQILLLFIIICLSDVIMRYFEEPLNTRIMALFKQPM